MSRPTVVICVDGFDPEYLEACDTPNLREMGRRGFLKTGRCVMPSVTNVNNVSLLTASYPEIHGISSNYRLVRETGEEVYMESSEYLLAQTAFQRAQALGRTSLLVTSKDKLRTLLADGATFAVSSEQAPGWLTGVVGEPPQIYSLEVNGWAIRAGSYLLSRFARDAAFVYISTTDYAMHTYPPEATESQRHMSILDNAVGDLAEAHPDATILITADHGMSAKTRMVDLGAALARRGIGARPVPIIKDRYVVHHSNLGGCTFVYLEDVTRVREALGVLAETPGVECALPRDEAARELRLHRERIGDIVVTGEADVVFGDPREVELPAGLRSHASFHEQEVPLIGFNGEFEGFRFEENLDMGRYLFERVLV